MPDNEKPAPASQNRRRRRRSRSNGGNRRNHSDTGKAISAATAESVTTTTVHRGRRTVVEVQGAVVSLPSTGKNPSRKRNSRPTRKAPKQAVSRKRTLTKTESNLLGNWLQDLSPNLAANLYKGLGGQPGRVESHERMVELTLRAVTKGGRLNNLVHQLNDKSKKALCTLIQAGGVAHNSEFLHELSHSFGGHAKDWERTLISLGNRGVIMASPCQGDDFFFVVPTPLIDGLADALADDMRVTSFDDDKTGSQVEITDSLAFCPPLDFTVTTLATYIGQHSPRLTQKHEIYRVDKEEMEAFFKQLWSIDSDAFAFHLDFLMMHGLVAMHGEYLTLNKEVMDRWLQAEPEDQRDLFFRALNEKMTFAEWVLWAIHEGGGAWMPEGPLANIYRRWKRGEDWRDRYKRGQYSATRTNDRMSFSFAPLVSIGLLEMGRWGQEKLYRLSERGKHLLSPPADNGYSLFYLTPSFEIMAPAGLAPILLYRISELALLTGVDRANTFKISEESINHGLDAGWQRDDVLQFLRDNSQIGLPDNVEDTLKGWIGYRGDIQFQDAFIMTVHRSQIKRLESSRTIKPYILHRFAPGLYAVDKTKIDEITAMLKDSGFDPSSPTSLQGDGKQAVAQRELQALILEARASVVAPSKRGASVIKAEHLTHIPGSKLANQANEAADRPPEVNETDARAALDTAIATGCNVLMVYATRSGEKVDYFVTPERLAFKGDSVVLVALDLNENARRSYLMEQIERIQLMPNTEDS
jgi:hypothetical protein